jgi:hypothetical protein
MSKAPFISSKPSNWVTPFPTIGEVVRVVANVLETKGDSSKNYDRLARGEIFDHEEVRTLWDNAFNVIPPELVSGKTQHIVNDIKEISFKEYVRICGEGFSCGYTREDIMDCLNRKIAAVIYDSMIKILDGRSEILHKIIASDKSVSIAFEYNKDEWEEFRKNPPCGKGIDAEKTKENVYRWMRGEQTPGMKDMYEAVRIFCDLNNMDLERLYSVFLCAKVIENIARYERLLGELRNIDGGKTVSEDEYYEPLEKTLYFCVGDGFWTKRRDRLDDYSVQSKKIEYELHRPNDRDMVGKLLENLEKYTTQLQDINICWWGTQRQRAYWYVLSGEWDKAKGCYEEILDIIFYTGVKKENVDRLFSEMLPLAAIFEDRPFLKKIKNLGITFGLFGKPYTNHSNSKYSNANKESRTKDFVVEDSEVKAWAGRFYDLFPKNSFFIPESELPKPVGFSGELFYVEGDMPQEADIKDKNKNISIQHVKYPQLVWFAQEGPAKEVEKLLKAGADVNKLSSSGDSALLLAITSMDMTLMTAHRDIKIFEMLSQYPHKKETLEVLTNKKRLNVLGSAVETGNPDIVDKVLEMMKAVKANVDIKYGGDDQTPLYTAISLFKASEKYLNIENDVSPPELFEFIRRQNDIRGGITTEETKQRYIEERKNPLFAQILEWTHQISSDQCKKAYRPEKILMIIEALLDAGSNPNKPHNKYNGLLMGYTPLMLAAEFDWVEAFGLLVKHGGDVDNKFKYIHTMTGKPETANCWRVALNYRADRILRYMEKNCKGGDGKILIY